MVECAVLIASLAVAASISWLLVKFLFPHFKVVPEEFYKQLGTYGRQLGDFETFYVYHNKNKSLYVATALIFEAKVPLTEDLIKRAIDYIWERHPLLRCKIVSYKNNDQKETFFFKENVSKPYYLFKSTSVKDWVEVAYEEFSERFDIEEGPLWRIQMLQPEPTSNGFKYTLVFTCLHVVDGICILQIFREFARNLESLIDGNDVEIECQPLLPSLEEIFHQEVTPTAVEIIKHRLSKLVSLSRPTRETEIGRDLVNAFKVNRKRGTRIHPFNFDESTTEAILKRVKMKGVRMQAVSTVVAGVALRRLMDKYGVRVGQNFNVSTAYAVSYRFSGKGKDLIGAEAMGVYMYPAIFRKLFVAAHISTEDFWRMAEKFNTDTHESLDRGDHFTAMKQASLDGIFSEEAMIAANSQKQDWERPLDIGMSNWGRNNLSTDGKYIKILNVFTGTGTSTFDYYCYLFLYVITVDGRMNWTLQYRGELMSDDMAVEYAQLIKSTLLEVCSET